MYSVKIADNQTTINEIINLRYKILRQPWSKPYETSTDDLETSSINAYIEHEGQVVACGRLQNNGSAIGQIRFMAVDETFQNKGLGKLILAELENQAKRINLKNIELQARENALQFYKSKGYTVKEKSFKLWDIIQHYLMTKEL